MTKDNKENGVVWQIVIPVVIALITGSTYPWWWTIFFPSRTSINVAYRGEYWACNLQISISIGDQKFYPQSNPFPVNNIEPGSQKYEISGIVNCPNGQCQVFGQGLINVTSGNTYYIAWQPTNSPQCHASLQ
jgi:hypothetical protein